MYNNQNSKENRKPRKKYTLAFKLLVVDEVEKGYLTYKQAQRKYNILGHCTVLKWLRKHGKYHWGSGGSMGNRKTPHAKIKELERKVKQLEEEKIILNTAIDIADEMLDTNIRKKYLPVSYKNAIKRKKEEE